MKAVRYDGFGDVDVLQVVDVETPVPGAGRVLVQVKAAAINPGEAAIRLGYFAERFPSTFPSGQGSDLAGVVAEVGPGVTGFAVGDEVLGYSHDRASQAEYVAVPAGQLVPRPADLPWEQAGCIYIAGTAAWAGVHAVGLSAGDVVAVSGAAGGVGGITVQLAKLAGATVIGLAGDRHHDWLRGHGVIPVSYDADVPDRIRAAAGEPVDAFLDCFGSGYVELAVRELGLPAARINTVIDFPAAARFGTHADGNAAASRPEVLAELADRVARGEVEIPIAAAYPLAQVREAFQELEWRHTLGKIVLVP